MKEKPKKKKHRKVKISYNEDNIKMLRTRKLIMNE